MKKKIIVLFIITLCLCATALFFTTNRRQNTVSKFGLYPCAYTTADEIDISAPGRSMTLALRDGKWRLTRPHDEAIDDGALAQFNIFMGGKLFVDDKTDVDAQTRKDYESPIPTRVAFKHNGDTLCAFELGKSVQLPTTDDERRWVFPEGSQTAVRTFVPLIDYGKLLEQPTFGWRMKKLFETNADIESIDIITPTESFSLDKGGEKSARNAPGWRISQIRIDDEVQNHPTIPFDIDRIATLLAHLSPLYVDDIAYDLTDEEKNDIVFAGKVHFKTTDGEHTLEIGTPADLSKHPEWTFYGEGTRYVRFDNSPTIAIMAPQRIVGIFPSLIDMRSKEVWQLDSTSFSSIEIAQGDQCLRYRPIAPNVWGSTPCDGEQNAISEIPDHELALFVKSLTSIKAIRFVTELELDSAKKLIDPPDVEVRIYTGTDNALNKILRLSEKRQSLFRYAQIFDENTKTETPIFVIDENMAALLLRIFAPNKPNQT